jgi:hypothetical protein
MAVIKRTFRIIKEEELDIQGRKKKFIEGTDYYWDIFIKTYIEKFTETTGAIPPREVIIDCGNSILSEEIHELDMNKTFVEVVE